MAKVNDSEILSKIQYRYVPFLKKLITFLEKKKVNSETVSKLKSILTVFTSSSAQEQIETFHANEEKLENWYNKTHKARKGSAMSDTDSSQGASDNAASFKKNTFKGSVTSPEQSSTSLSSVTSNSSLNETNQIKQIPLSQIKKEKVESVIKPKTVEAVNVDKTSNTAPQQTPRVVNVDKTSDTAPQQAPEAAPADSPIVFTCASCQFQTLDETEFMKHARTDHRTDLSMWCKQCGKCFSNAGVLVSHIKERGCVKEEMIYRCGVKDCVFETTSGQTFVHHLRHCHKGSPFIFCVHCAKIFTLPHCLILHMQDDCPYKDKNRRNPGSSSTETNSTADSSTPANPVYTPPVTNIVKPSQTLTSPVTNKVTPPTPVQTPVPCIISKPSVRGRLTITPRGRGRGRGRARPPSDSSDSDDPDDPSWRPEETLGSTTLRRSGRWAKKVNDVINVEPSSSGLPKPVPKRALSLELNSKEMLICPCCDFMAAFQSVLEGHYIAHHKVPNKNACLVCSLKFEDTKSFLEHFEQHAKGTLINKAPEIQEPPVSSQPKVSDTNKTKSSTPVIKDDIPEPILSENEIFDGVVTSLSEANVIDPTSDKTQIKIPYQAAIHDKNLKDSKLKKFEELKSPNDLVSMRNELKLKHFFKCVLYNCTYTCDDTIQFCYHVNNVHPGKRLHCGYCFKEFFSGENLTEHMLSEHGKRQYQCSNCFYRAYSKIHVQIHIKNHHAKDTQTEVYTCGLVEIPDYIKKSVDSNDTLNTTWPYICAIGDCKFQSFDPKEFKRHNETLHRSVSVFFCHYCHVDFISFKRLFNHYRLHGINTFQCNYCIHGSETKDEILLHLCNAHADQPLRAYVRGSHEDASSEAMKLSVRNDVNSNAKSLDNAAPKKTPDSTDITVVDAPSDTVKDKLQSGCENELYHIVDDDCYPRGLRIMCADFFCGIPFCHEKFENILSYVGHLRNAHAAVNFPCPHCHEVSQTWADFKNHLMCHGPNLYACNSTTCDFCDWDKNKVMEHVKVHPEDTCEVITVRESAAESEENSDISVIKSLPAECPFKIGDKSFECLFCRYKSSNRTIMKNHIYSEMAFKRFCCVHCNRKCLSKKEITDHFKSLHPDYDIRCSVENNPEVEFLVEKFLTQPVSLSQIKAAYSCVVCCKKFKSFLHSQSHLFVCLRKEYRPYDCGYCKDSFSALKALKYHIDEKHHPKTIDFSVVYSYAIDDEINKRLLQLRLMYFRDVFKENKLEDYETQNVSQKFKYYTCSVCPYESDYKFNVQKHIENLHRDKDAEVQKSVRDLNLNENATAHSDENSNDSLKISSESSCSKRYRCGFCIKKMYTIQELENHVEKLHSVKNEAQYFYYYSPDDKTEFSPNDKEIYECAYCKSCNDNLYALKKHSDLMHSEMQFKVKGYVVRNKTQTSYLACGHCYLRLDSQNDLKKHSASYHPTLPEKSIGSSFQGSSTKRSSDDTNDFSNKRVKLGSTVYVCSHCGGAFSSQTQVATHSKQTHSRLPLEFHKISQSSNNMGSNVKFYKCEFCSFVGEKHYVDKHRNSKHKMRVSCYYCNRRFEFATKLKEHHDVCHKDKPVKYCQEMVTAPTTKVEQKYSVSPTNLEDVKNIETETSPLAIPEKTAVSYYGKRPEPVDLNSLTVFMEDKGEFVNLPLVYFARLFNISPRVVVKDINK